MGTRTILWVNTGEQTVTFYQDTETKLCNIVTEDLLDGMIVTPVKSLSYQNASDEFLRRTAEYFKIHIEKEEPVQDIVTSQIIKMIAIQACSTFATGRSVGWCSMKVRPTFEQAWFWEHFSGMVQKARMHLSGAVEGWITVEYGEEIEGILESHSTRGG